MMATVETPTRPRKCEKPFALRKRIGHNELLYHTRSDFRCYIIKMSTGRYLSQVTLGIHEDHVQSFAK